MGLNSQIQTRVFESCSISKSYIIGQNFELQFTQNMKFVFLFLLFSLFTLIHGYTNEKKVLLSSVDGITFHKGRFTTSRRLPPSIQLKRVGGEVRSNFEPESIYCQNKGSDGISIQW
jgi:hypothetical protein